MKKIIFLLLVVLSLNSCATILGGKRTECQVKQRKGQAKKEIRVGFLVADIVLIALNPGIIIVDFLTGKIYKKEAKSCE